MDDPKVGEIGVVGKSEKDQDGGIVSMKDDEEGPDEWHES